MAKRYYWLKLKEDFFEDDTIQYIEEQTNGILYSNFYLKLCLKSLKGGGRLIRVVGDTLIPYDAPALAKLTGVPVDTVRCAMALFNKIGLVSELDTGELFLQQINELVGTETDKAASMRRLRAKKDGAGNNVTPMLPERYPDIDIEKDIELEEENRDRAESEDSAVPDHPVKESKTSKIPYDQVQNLYNLLCPSLPKCMAMSDSRKKAVKKLMQTGVDLDSIQKLFKAAERSDFLSGRSGDWRASFDWLMKPANATKTLEGNYENRCQQPNRPQPKTNNIFLQVGDDDT